MKKKGYLGVAFTFFFAIWLSGCVASHPKTDDTPKEPVDTGSTENETDTPAPFVPLSSIYDDGITNEWLVRNNFIIYAVSCGAENKEVPVDVNGESGKAFTAYANVYKSENGDPIFARYQSVSDKEFGPDIVTGKSWGYIAREDIKKTGNPDAAHVLANGFSCTAKSDYVPGETGFYYDFEVPNGKYEVVCGFNDPFTTRKLDIFLEGEKLVSQEKIFKYEVTEISCTQEVKDGILNLVVCNTSKEKDEFKRPILTYVIVKALPKCDRDLVETVLKISEECIANSDDYKEASLTQLVKAVDETKKTLASAKDNENWEERYTNIMNAYEKLDLKTVYKAFEPGEIWLDTDGTPIQAHGGHIQRLTVKDRETGELVEKWWWVGEDKTNGYRGGINAYSSTDLYNWQFEGTVMRNVTSRSVLDTDPYFKELYADYTKEQLDNVYLCINSTTSVIERPKMIYNEKTGLYVMWFHADGPTATSNSNYAAASAGVAVSDSPYGPFKFIDRYRLNVCPPDQEDKHPSSRGMARDMNLYIDDDGTAYIIYSSEENLTLYISKLNDEYTYLATPPEKAVYGKDFIRIFPGAQREAPALFKKDGKYYLMSSGCTGWAPNQARYAVADSVLGEWVNMGDPCIGDTSKTTFSSQSTCIFCADPEKQLYIYMGDRWFSDTLNDSRYIWLPIEFDEKGNMSIRFKDKWTLD